MILLLIILFLLLFLAAGHEHFPDWLLRVLGFVLLAALCVYILRFLLWFPFLRSF